MTPRPFFPPSRRFFKALLACAALAASTALSGCGRDVVRESGVHGDGTRAWAREYVMTSGAGKVAHGAHATWYPDGTRRTLEFFEYGARQGYAFEWDESGSLARLRSCEAGVCEARPVRLRAPAGTMLAGNGIR